MISSLFDPQCRIRLLVYHNSYEGHLVTGVCLVVEHNSSEDLRHTVAPRPWLDIGSITPRELCDNGRRNAYPTFGCGTPNHRRGVRLSGAIIAIADRTHGAS